VENGVGYVKKNFLAGLELPDFSALNPAARQWLNPVANVRLHSETWDKPVQAWHKERPYLSPLPLHPFDIATVSQVRAWFTPYFGDVWRDLVSPVLLY
jgi:hypothetical protein